jgi:hypothetical protein
VVRVRVGRRVHVQDVVHLMGEAIKDVVHLMGRHSRECEFTLGSHLVRLEQQQRGLIAISPDLDGRIQRALDAHARGCGEDELELGDHLGAPGFVTQLRGAQAGPCALGTARRLVRRLLAPRLLRPVQRVLRLALKRCGMGGMVEARPFNGRLAGRVERVTVHRLERGAARLWGGEGAVVSTCMLAGG